MTTPATLSRSTPAQRKAAKALRERRRAAGDIEVRIWVTNTTRWRELVREHGTAEKALDALMDHVSPL